MNGKRVDKIQLKIKKTQKILVDEKDLSFIFVPVVCSTVVYMGKKVDE